jgi:alkaline phosphatase
MNNQRRNFFATLAWLPFLATFLLALGGCSSTGGTRAAGQTPKNIIIMFADGAAPTQWDFGRYSSRVLRNQPFATTDVVFRDGVLGLMTTSPHGPYVTDSAAAASALSTGYKVENGAVSMTPDGKPQRTLMQAAKAAGKRIGLVTTATVYDATPAAFSINAKSRRDSQALVDLYLALEPTCC